MRTRSSYLLMFLFLLPLCAVMAQDPGKELARLKKADDLNEWLVLRMKHAAAEPDSRLAFLMNTQKEAWRKPGSAPEKRSWFHLLVNQGYYLLSNGNIIRSIDAYERARAFYEDAHLSGIDLAEYLYKPLSNNYLRLNDYSSAIHVQRMGLEFALRAGDSLQAASFYNDLATSYLWFGNSEQAGNMARSGLKLVPRSSALNGLLTTTLGNISFELQDFTTAQAQLERALTTLQRMPPSAAQQYWLLNAYTLAGNIALEKKQFSSALGLYQKGLRVIRDKFNDELRREKAHLLNQRGEVYRRRAQYKQAYQSYDEALAVLIPSPGGMGNAPEPQQLFAESNLFDALAGRGSTAVLLGDEQVGLQDMLLALRSAERSRSIVLSQSDKVRYTRRYNNLIEEALDLCYALWRKLGNPYFAETMLALVEESKSRLLADEFAEYQLLAAGTDADSLIQQQLRLRQAIIQYETDLLTGSDNKATRQNKTEASNELSILEKRIAARYPALRPQTVPAGQSVAALLEALPDEIVVLNYFFGNKTGYCLVIKNQQITDIRQLSDVGMWNTRIEKYTARFYRNGPAAMKKHPRDFFRESALLYNYLIPDGLSDSSKALLVVPSGVTNDLPFESLITDTAYVGQVSKWPYLVRRSAIAYAYSLNTWLAPLRDHPLSRFSGFFVERSRSDAQEGLTARWEHKYLSAALRGTFYTGPEANTSRLHTAFERSSVLHISTHSTAMGSNRVPALETADGTYSLFNLTASEQMPGLVVLSACCRADGSPATEGMHSLVRAFTAAGTNGTVAGLWNVNNKAAAEQMRTFYERLIKVKRPDRALHEMKLDWLAKRHTDQSMLLPYYWATLVYTGKFQEVELQEKFFLQKDETRILVVAAVVLIIISVMLQRRNNKRSGRRARKTSP